jgi:2-polyprenyl-3-methyl-5-hydroxy-6-metoxy-1,4-benzoquinol methylase
MKKSRNKKNRSSPQAVKSAEGILYPYSRKNISDFFARHDSVRVAYLKIERSIDDFGHHICDIILNAGGERLFLQGIEFLRNRFRYPSHLEAIPTHVKKTLEQQVIHRLLQTRVIETPLSEQELAYTGERVVPGTAPFHAYWMHARRYAFAAERCRGKRVLDAGCGSGYGARILALEAVECLGVDNDPEAVRLAESLFGSPGLTFAVTDVTKLEAVSDDAFDVVVALEVLEHLPPESIPAFMAAVRRVLSPDGTFVVSVANRMYRDREENPFHLSEMTFEEFEQLLRSRFGPSKIDFFGQSVWAGTWQLARECRIEPIRSATSHHVYLGVVEARRSE